MRDLEALHSYDIDLEYNEPDRGVGFLDRVFESYKRRSSSLAGKLPPDASRKVKADRLVRS
jgi:hypothetical protein